MDLMVLYGMFKFEVFLEPIPDLYFSTSFSDQCGECLNLQAVLLFRSVSLVMSLGAIRTSVHAEIMWRLYCPQVDLFELIKASSPQGYL